MAKRFFAGTHTLMTQSTGTVAQAKTRAINILYGSQTGNAESVANNAAAVAIAHGLLPKVLSMNEIEIEALAELQYLLIITSTYGEGEMPDNAQILWEAVSVDSTPSMDNLKYSVLALGDTSFDQFCQAGIDWDNRLQKLGANRIAERVDCDVDFEDLSENWINSVISLMSEGVHVDIIETDATPDTGKSKYHRKHPFPAKLLVNRLLTAEHSSKEIRHYEISIEGSGLTYETGDALSVIPINCPELVREIIQSIKHNGDEHESVNGQPMTLTEALLTHFEIKLPSKDFIEEIAYRSGDQELNDILESGNKDKLSDYLWGRDILDLLLQFPEVDFSAVEFINLLKPLQHRTYSISSSARMYPDHVHLTVASVRYESHGRNHKGVCSTFLADLAKDETSLLCFFAPNKVFRVPDDNDLPMIMVGPGTGIAPFRAFLQEREIRKAKGKNWLFFGDRNISSDFIYQHELESMQKNGLLTRIDFAFSRDQEEKSYVQDRMRENGTDLYSWLEQGGYFFVSGDTYYMAKDVDKALHDIIAEHGRMTAQQAAEYVNQLKKDNRYVRDVY